MSDLIRVGIMLESSSVDVVVSWIAIDEPIKEECIEGEAP